MITRRKLVAVSAASAAASLTWTRAGHAQTTAWPTRFVKLVVPFTPGGGIDGLGRIVGARLSEKWGQQVVVENKPGAGGNIASEYVARSAPDGHTMYITAGGMAVNKYLFASAQLRPGGRLRAGDVALQLPQPAGGAEFVAVQFGRRSCGRGAEESRQGDIRNAGSRQFAAHEWANCSSTWRRSNSLTSPIAALHPSTPT